MTTTRIGQLFSLAYTKPFSTSSTSTPVVLPGAKMYFYVSGSSYATLQTVYQDSGLTTAASNPLTADAYGRFAPVFLNPALQYGWALQNAAGATLEQVDPINVQNVALPVQVYKPANTARASTTTLVADPDLTYAIPAAGSYKIELDILAFAATSGATPGIAFSVAFSGSLNGSAGNTLAVQGGLNGAALTTWSVAINSTYSGPLNTSGTLNGLRIVGTIQVTSAGTLSFNWAQQASSASATTLLANSSMAITRIA